MEEFEISGAREWQIEGSNHLSRPKGSGPHGQTHFETLGQKTSGTVSRRPPATNGNNEIALPTRPNQAGLQPSAGAGNQFQAQYGSNGERRGMPSWVHNRRNQPTTGNRNNGAVMGDTRAKASWRAGRPCAGRFRLPVPYVQFKQWISDYASSMGSNIQGDIAFFEQVSRLSGAFIPPPNKDTDNELSIWGHGGQLRTARRILQQLMSTPPPGSKKKAASFAKITSYSESKEAQLNLVQKNDSILQQLRSKPDPSLTMPETLIFLWPTEELPLESTLGSSLEDLDPLRREFGCYFYVYEEDPNYIRVDAFNHESIIKIVHRLRAKWAELMANRHVKMKLYLVQPPSTDILNNEVKVVKIPQHENGYAYATPLLFCNPALGSIQMPGWQDRNNLVRAKNDVRLREAVERSLQGLRFLRGHVRMRVHFGTFVLDDYRVPKDSKTRYPFEEFRSMLFHAKTKGHLIPGLKFQQGTEDLITKCSAASDILAPYEATAQSLEDAEPLYAVNFEFEGESTSLLRLEAEFSKSPASGLFEVSQRRWVNPQGEDRSGDKKPPLQIGVIDFESSDWQLEIKALEFHEPDSITQSLRTFSHSIRFSRGSTDGLRGEGRRRVTFSEGAPVARLIEKSALRYRLKGTNYILELARYDEYARVPMPISTAPNIDVNLGTTNRISNLPVTSWGASIFDQQWDNMLGQHANFGLGHSAEWSPSLNTFFPCRDDPNPSDLRVGFNQFTELANRIAVLLGPTDKVEETMSSPMRGDGGATSVPKNKPFANTIKSWAEVVKVPGTEA